MVIWKQSSSTKNGHTKRRIFPTIAQSAKNKTSLCIQYLLSGEERRLKPPDYLNFNVSFPSNFTLLYSYLLYLLLHAHKTQTGHIDYKVVSFDTVFVHGVKNDYFRVNMTSLCFVCASVMLFLIFHFVLIDCFGIFVCSFVWFFCYFILSVCLSGGIKLKHAQ